MQNNDKGRIVHCPKAYNDEKECPFSGSFRVRWFDIEDLSRDQSKILSLEGANDKLWAMVRYANDAIVELDVSKNGEKIESVKMLNTDMEYALLGMWLFIEIGKGNDLGKN